MTDTARLQRKARFWDRTARKYAASPIADPVGYERSLQRVRGLLAPQDRVLELGCGSGSTALRLAPDTASYLATDVSAEMIAIAREKLAAQPVPTLRFEVADAEMPPAGAGCHDAVLAFNLLHLVADLDAALRSLLVALRPGGLLITKTPCLAEMNPLIPRLVVPLMRALDKAPPVLCLNAERLVAAFERQGLRIEAVERHASKGKDFRPFIIARRPVCGS
jgi:SAM-dependent methyltransferase